MNQSEHNLDYDAELGLIGAILTAGQAGFHDAIETVSVTDFCEVRALAAWKIIQQMDEKGLEVSETSFLQHARANGSVDDIGDLPSFVASCGDLGLSVSINGPEVVENSKRRRAAQVASTITAKCKDRSKPVDEIVADAESLLAGEQIQSAKVLNPKAFVVSLTDDLERRVNMQGKLTGVETGFSRLDKLTNGIQYGEMAIIAARPSMGKTAFGCNVVEHACLRNAVPTLFVTLEMSPAALGRRIASSYCSIPALDLRSGLLSQEQIKLLTRFAGKAASSPLHVMHPSSPDVSRVCAAIRREVRKNGIRLVVVDYLGKLVGSGRHDRKTYEVAEVSGALKACAVSTGAAFLVLAQLNRESERGRETNGGKPVRPKLTDLADSTQIERDADLVGLLFRDRADESVKPELIIAKQRDGEVGIVSLKFDGRYCRFSEPQASGSDFQTRDADFI